MASTQGCATSASAISVALFSFFFCFFFCVCVRRVSARSRSVRSSEPSDPNDACVNSQNFEQ